MSNRTIMERTRLLTRKYMPTFGKIFGIRPLKHKDWVPNANQRRTWSRKLENFGFTVIAADYIVGTGTEITYGEIVQRAIETMKTLPPA